MTRSYEHVLGSKKYEYKENAGPFATEERIEFHEVSLENVAFEATRFLDMTTNTIASPSLPLSACLKEK